MNKNINVFALLCLAIFCSLTACSTKDTETQEQAISTQKASVNAEAEVKEKVLKHIVALQFKAEISAEEREQAIQRFRDLEGEIPEILSFEGGGDISVEDLNKGFTHCFILTFKDEAARDAYLPHPAHMSVANKNKPMLSDLLVVDVWSEK
ncbi:MAG: Dabb family protein [Bacteroidota bacterium]